MQKVHLASGTLSLDIFHTELPLEDILGFGVRNNPKRGFLFVSKVLGKHIPVKPSVMKNMYQILAKKIQISDCKPVFISMAETATALGFGIAEQWRKHNNREALFLHSTRYKLNNNIAFEFKEPHSHATDHIVYEPVKDKDTFYNTENAIIIDDEISTGNTLINFVNEYKKINSNLKNIVLVSITDWSGNNQKNIINAFPDLNVDFVSVLHGSFEFEKNNDFTCESVNKFQGNDDFKDSILTSNHGRFGENENIEIKNYQHIIDSVKTDDSVLVLGTGEFSYLPYLLAEKIEEKCKNTMFQTTTRSPVIVGEDIQSAIQFTDNYQDNMTNFVYNVADKYYSKIFVCSETVLDSKFDTFVNGIKAKYIQFENNSIKE